MPLTTHVTDRIPAQRLVNLTRPGTPSATTRDDVLLGLAATDAQAEFETRAGLVYNDADAQHIAVAVLGVLYYLHLWTGITAEGLARAEARWREGLEALAKVTARDRVLARSTSNLTPTREAVTSGVARPSFDPERFAPLQLRAPGTAGDDRA